MNKKQTTIFSVLITLSLVLLSLLGTSPAAAEGNDESTAQNMNTEFKKIRIALIEDVEIKDAVLLLKDGTSIELGSDDSFDLDKSYHVDQVSEFEATISGEQYTVPLSDPQVALGTLIIEISFEEGQEVSGATLESPEGNEGEAENFTGVKLKAAEGIEVEAAKLVLADLTPVLLKKSEAGVFLTGDEQVSRDDLFVVMLMIDGKEHTINLKNRDYQIDAEGFLHISIDEEILNGGEEMDAAPKESGMLPETGDSSDAMFYLAGLLLISLGMFSLRKRKLCEE
ncbi:LPXTG cell wall anchor domain-containing protein [Bacillus salacetis]|uniref:LPXTG cell wall anchor domain-containing protein n=1 Tax=Bacillus salacetis TaxID=2315464 RepID=UPI003B9FFB0B